MTYSYSVMRTLIDPEGSHVVFDCIMLKYNLFVGHNDIRRARPTPALFFP